jgi:hypothetical protein
MSGLTSEFVNLFHRSRMVHTLLKQLKIKNNKKNQYENFTYNPFHVSTFFGVCTG